MWTAAINTEDSRRFLLSFTEAKISMEIPFFTKKMMQESFITKGNSFDKQNQ